MSSKPTVLVLGATGFTGKLITRYLASHRDRDAFTLVLGARSQQRLESLAKDLDLDDTVQRKVIDVTKPHQVNEAVAFQGVVLNTVGPFLIWGTPVVEACVRHGTHYVDLTGETAWIKRIVSFHFSATKTGAIIVPSSGFDSVPADILSYASAKALRDFTGSHVDIDSSISAYTLRGGFSGGTISTAISMLEQLPPDERKEARKPFALSPAVGANSPGPRFVYSLYLPHLKKTLNGGFFFMSMPNRALQQRSWGLLELEAAADKNHPHYGPHMKYDEFLVTGGRLSGLLLSLGELLVFGAFMITPIRWLLKKFLPQAGEGPSETTMRNGKMVVQNVTTSVASGSALPLQAESVLKGKGDPGYWLATYIISEAALSIALQFDELPALGKRGGVLTPATALGDVLVKRMNATGVLSLESRVVEPSA